ncbi:MAG: inorganic phosphate transporter [Candidatus Aenigmarchaeota archaeon]|nr:inorganic phosphate transporter [Candidatus Aenigmarchaeota archaeon]
MLEIALLLSLILAFIVGSNDVMGSLGIAYGSRILSMKKTIILMAIFGVIGISFFGHMIINTIGNGIAEIINPLPIVVSAIIMAVAVLYFRIPTSMTQIVIGSIAGYALAVESTVYWGNFIAILVSQIISPIIAIFLAGYMYLIYSKYVTSRRMEIEIRLKIKKLITYLQIVVGCLMAIALGAMEVGVVMGFNLGIENLMILETLGAVGIVLGISVWGRKIMRHVSRGFVSLTPEKGFVAQLAGLITVLCFFAQSIPVSPTAVIMGSIIGIGRVTGKMNRNIFFDILVLWVFVVPFSMMISFLVATIM